MAQIFGLFQSYYSLIFNLEKHIAMSYSVSYFNPIIVLFLTPGLEFMIVEISNFNPIIVLFLTRTLQNTDKLFGDFNPIIVLFLTFQLEMDFPANTGFQSYYSLIFNSRVSR